MNAYLAMSRGNEPLEIDVSKVKPAERWVPVPGEEIEVSNYESGPWQRRHFRGMEAGLYSTSSTVTPPATRWRFARPITRMSGPDMAPPKESAAQAVKHEGDSGTTGSGLAAADQFKAGDPVMVCDKTINWSPAIFSSILPYRENFPYKADPLKPLNTISVWRECRRPTLAEYRKHFPNHWIPHDGGGCPVEMGVTVFVRFQDGRENGPYTLAVPGIGWTNGEITHWRYVK